MDSKKILALLCAIEHGSLTSAAAELGYTQSGLTHMMNSLEDELGVNLLIRSKNGVRLSPTGQALLPEMRAVLNSAMTLEQSAEKLRQQSVFTLRMGAYASVARRWLPAIIAEFRTVNPELDVTIKMGGITGTYDAVKNDELDCAFVSHQPSMCQGLVWIPLHDDELIAVLPASYQLDGEAFPVECFSGEDFLMPSLGFEMDINPVFSAQGKRTTPHIMTTGLDDASIISMVEHNLGITILSRLVMQGMTANVRFAPLFPAAYRSLGIIVSERRQNDKSIKRLISCAQSVINKMYSA